MKKEKGITLLALIITIIIMLILVAVTLTIALGDNGIINNAKEATEEQKLATEKEKILGLEVEYYNAYGADLSDETIEEIATIAVETGIDASKFTVLYNKKDSREIILYRYNKTTEEERTNLEEKEIKMLRGDTNLDGFLTQADIDLIAQAESFQIELTPIQVWTADMDSSIVIDIGDREIIRRWLIGDTNYEDEVIYGELRYEDYE